jgi:hypothetical protein
MIRIRDLLVMMLWAVAGAAQAQAPSKPIACALEQLDLSQRQVAAEAYLTTDILPRKAASKLIGDALGACPEFKAMSDKQVSLAIDYSQSAVVAELIAVRLTAMKAPPSLIDTVWETFDDTQRGWMLAFARNKAPNADLVSKAIDHLVAKAKGTPDMVDPVTMGLAARAIMEEVQSGW